MSNKSISIIIGLILIVGIGGLVYWQKNSTQTNLTDTTTDTVEETDEVMTSTEETAKTGPETTSEPTDATSIGSGLTAEAVATHNSASSCWAIINGNVYDLTGWIPNHPGGPEAILQLCGTDATAKFTGKHDGNSKVLSILAGFKLGALEN